MLLCMIEPIATAFYIAIGGQDFLLGLLSVSTVWTLGYIVWVVTR